jgi:hypothetical protein
LVAWSPIVVALVAWFVPVVGQQKIQDASTISYEPAEVLLQQVTEIAFCLTVHGSSREAIAVFAQLAELQQQHHAYSYALAFHPVSLHALA